MAAEVDLAPARLVLSVRFADGRFHGRDEWPPAPARLFQAIVAGVAHYGEIKEDALRALAWLETLQPPVIAAPRAKPGTAVTYFVPRNDGDRQELEDRRYPKVMRPFLFDEQVPLHYVWTIPPGDTARARQICQLAERVYRLGHGIDAAWALGRIVNAAEFDAETNEYAGKFHKPIAKIARGRSLACPTKGSLESVRRSHEESLRLLAAGNSRAYKTPSRFAIVAYDSPPTRRVFDVRADAGFAAWAQERVAGLVQEIRAAASERLDRRLDGIRILPLPSIGHMHTPRGIRRILVEVPGDSIILPEDVFWAIARRKISNGAQLLPAVDAEAMLANYGVGRPFTTWRTITPAVLAEGAARRRIDPGRRREEAKSASGRSAEEMRAAVAAHTDLRLRQMLPQVGAIKVQREPFEANGSRAEWFAPGSGFVKERLWHVEVTFVEPVEGPVFVGEGVHLGLGLMAPAR